MQLSFARCVLKQGTVAFSGRIRAAGGRFSTSSDLAPGNARIHGVHVIALKPGHAANADLAREIVKQHAKIAAFCSPPFPPGERRLDNQSQ